MSLKFSLRMMCIEETGIDPETGIPPEGKIKELLEKILEAKEEQVVKKVIKNLTDRGIIGNTMSAEYMIAQLEDCFDARCSMCGSQRCDGSKKWLEGCAHWRTIQHSIYLINKEREDGEKDSEKDSKESK